jgi:ABC-type molybdate transport system substrate-binding protein
VRVSIASPLTRPSPNGRRVGIRIVTFEACSGFTHVTARRIAQPPEAAFVTRLQPFRLPGRAARQLPDQSTTLWVESSSTDDSRLRGALPLIDQLQAQGKVVAGSRVNIAKVGVGVFVRKGAAKPDISSADAFKRSMLAARSIAYPDPAGGGASGIYVASLLERLGIAVEMKPKTKLFPPTEVLYASVASGEVEIGFNQISEILAQPTVQLAGPLPSAIQNYTQFAPGIVTGSSQTDAGRALVTFLSSPAAQIVLKAKGFE